VVGLVRGVQGLRGTVRVEVLTDWPERFEPGSVLFREGEGRPLTITWRTADGPGMLVRFKEVRSREAAEALREVYLEAELGDAPLAEGAVWWHELEGAAVRTSDGEELGRVVDVFRSGGGEVLIVRGGERVEVLVPIVGGIVVEFAPRERRIIVDADALGLEPVHPRRPRGRRSSRVANAEPAGDASEAPG